MGPHGRDCARPRLGLPHVECSGEEAGNRGGSPSETFRGDAASGSLDRAPAPRGSPDEVRLDQAPRPHEGVQDEGSADNAPTGPSRPIEPAVLRRSEDPQRLLHHETSGRQMAPGEGTEASPGKGFGRCLPGHLLLRLGASKPAGHVGASVGLGGPPTEATQQGVSLRARGGLSIMSARLKNASNLCYANSVIQAVTWIMMTQGTAVGKLKACLRILQSSELVHLPDCLALRWLFAGWSPLHQQHDAGEFLAHCPNAAEAEAWEGRWESRLSEPFRVTDAGTLLRALPLPITGATLQSLLDAWSQQYAPHALTLHNNVIFLQLERYGADASKNQQLVRIRPGDQLAVPLYAEPASLVIRHETFQVVTVIYHVGHTVKSGHYMTLLGHPSEDGSWGFLVCDDNRSPRVARKTDLNLVDRNAYLIGLVRSQ